MEEIFFKILQDVCKKQPQYFIDSEVLQKLFADINSQEDKDRIIGELEKISNLFSYQIGKYITMLEKSIVFRRDKKGEDWLYDDINLKYLPEVLATTQELFPPKKRVKLEVENNGQKEETFVLMKNLISNKYKKDYDLAQLREPLKNIVNSNEFNSAIQNIIERTNNQRKKSIVLRELELQDIESKVKKELIKKIQRTKRVNELEEEITNTSLMEHIKYLNLRKTFIEELVSNPKQKIGYNRIALSDLILNSCELLERIHERNPEEYSRLMEKLYILGYDLNANPNFESQRLFNKLKRIGINGSEIIEEELEKRKIPLRDLDEMHGKTKGHLIENGIPNLASLIALTPDELKLLTGGKKQTIEKIQLAIDSLGYKFKEEGAIFNPDFQLQRAEKLRNSQLESAIKDVETSQEELKDKARELEELQKQLPVNNKAGASLEEI